MSILRLCRSVLREKVTLRLMKLHFNIVDLAEDLRFCHDISEILLMLALNTKTPINQISMRGGVQHYVIRFVCDLRQVGGFLRVLWFPPPIKLTLMSILRLCRSVLREKVTLRLMKLHFNIVDLAAFVLGFTVLSRYI
jgi:hypothetical protein